MQQAILLACNGPQRMTEHYVSCFSDDSNIESLPTEKQEQFQEIRCSSAAGRGSVYDSVAGKQLAMLADHVTQPNADSMGIAAVFSATCLSLDMTCAYTALLQSLLPASSV